MTAEFGYLGAPSLIGTWPMVATSLAGPAGGEFTLAARSISSQATLYGGRRQPAGGFDVAGKSFEIDVDASTYTVSFATGPLSIDAVVTEINTDVGVAVAFNNNGFLVLKSTTIGEGSYIRVRPVADFTILPELGLFSYAESRNGEIIPAQTIDPRRQIAAHKQLGLNYGEQFDASTYNRVALQLAVNADRSNEFIDYKRIAIEKDVVAEASYSPGSVPGVTLTDDVFVGADIAPSQARLEQLFAILDSEGNELIEEVETDGGSSGTYAVQVYCDPNSKVQYVELDAGHPGMFTATDTTQDYFVRLTGLSGSGNNILFKIIEYVNAWKVGIRNVDPTSGAVIEMNEGPSASIDAYRILVTSTKIVVTEVDDVSGGSRVEGVVQSRCSGAITRIEGNNRIVCNGLNFTTSGVVVGDQFIISGAGLSRPYSNNGTYRVAKIVDIHTVEVISDSYTPVLLNPIAGTGFGNAAVQSDGKFYNAPFLKFNTHPTAGVTVRVVYLGLSNMRDASDDPAFLSGGSIKYAQEASFKVQRTLMAVIGPSTTSFDQYLYSDDRKCLEDIYFSVGKEHNDRGRHTTIRPDKIDMKDAVAGETVIVRNAVADDGLSTVTKIGLHNSSGTLVFQVMASGRVAVGTAAAPKASIVANTAGTINGTAMYFGDTNTDGYGIGSITGRDIGGVSLQNNIYHDGTPKRYVTGFPSTIYMSKLTGDFSWLFGDTGAAGSAILLFTERMHITQTGRLSVGALSYDNPSPTLLVNSASAYIPEHGLMVGDSIRNDAVAGRVAAARIYAVSGSSVGISGNMHYNGTNWVRTHNGGYAEMIFNVATVGTPGDVSWQTAATGTQGTTISYTERMRLKQAGQLSIGAGLLPKAALVLNTTLGEDNSAIFFGDTNTNGRGIGRLLARDGVGVILLSNCYNLVGEKFYVGTGNRFANYFLMESVTGDCFWATTAVGTADGPITWLERMRLTQAGFLGVGTAAPHAPIQTSNAAGSRKLVMYEAADNDHQFFGIGVNANTFRLQVPDSAQNFMFYRADSTSASTLVAAITGTGKFSLNAGSTIAGAMLLNTGTGENNEFHFGSTIVGGRALGRISCTTGAGVTYNVNNYWNTDAPSGYKFWSATGYSLLMFQDSTSGNTSFNVSTAASGGAGTAIAWKELFSIRNDGEIRISAVTPNITAMLNFVGPAGTSIWLQHQADGILKLNSDSGGMHKFASTSRWALGFSNSTLGGRNNVVPSAPCYSSGYISTDAWYGSSDFTVGNIQHTGGAAICRFYANDGGGVGIAANAYWDMTGGLKRVIGGYVVGFNLNHTTRKIEFVTADNGTADSIYTPFTNMTLDGSGGHTGLRLNRPDTSHDTVMVFMTSGADIGYIGVVSGVTTYISVSLQTRFTGSIAPSSNGGYDLGVTSFFWRDLLLTRDIYFTPTSVAGTNALLYRAPSTGSITTNASDIRLKKNISTISETMDVISVLRELRGVYYNLDTDNPLVLKEATKREIGMIAQEVEAAGLSEFVIESHLKMPDGSAVKSLAYPNMVGFLVEVCKELNNKIELLKQELTALKA